VPCGTKHLAVNTVAALKGEWGVMLISNTHMQYAQEIVPFMGCFISICMLLK
jgi:hypothetical protein